MAAMTSVQTPAEHVAQRRHRLLFVVVSTSVLALVLVAAFSQVLGVDSTKPIVGAAKTPTPTVIVVRPTVTVTPSPHPRVSGKNVGKSEGQAVVAKIVKIPGEPVIITVSGSGGSTSHSASQQSTTPSTSGETKPTPHSSGHRSGPSPTPSSPAPTPLVCVTTVCVMAAPSLPPTQTPSRSPDKAPGKALPSDRGNQSLEGSLLSIVK